MKQELNVALVAGSMPGFSDEGPALYRRSAAALRKVADELDFTLTTHETLVTGVDQAIALRRELDAGRLDFVMLYHPTYINGEVACELMKVDAPVGLWAAAEPSRDGPLQLASMVCLNLNMSIASHYLKGKAVKWFFGNTDGPLFRRRFEITIRALKAIKTLKGARVAQIGQTAPGFLGMSYDEAELQQHLGVTVVQGIDIEDMLAVADGQDGQAVQEVVDGLRQTCRAIDVGASKLDASARLFLAIRQVCTENDLQAVALSCWPRLATLRNMKPCVANAMLDGIGIPTSCEGDMLSAISMLTLQAMGASSTAVMDLPAFDIEDDTLLLWHCGAAPFEMANCDGVRCGYHYRAAFDEKQGDDQDGPVTDLVYAPGPVTVFRFTGGADRYYSFSGEFFDGEKPSWDGSRGWVRDLKLCGEPISAQDLMNTILTGGLPHHYPMAMGDFSDELEEMAVWLGLKRHPRIPYTDHLIAP